MNCGRIFLAALAVTVFGMAWGMVTCGWLFNWVYELPPVAVWKTTEAMMTPLFWAINVAGHFVLAVIFVGVFAWIGNGLCGGRFGRGFRYGLAVWLVGILPGMFAVYMWMAVNPWWPVYTAINQLIALPICGIIASAIVLPCTCECKG